MKQKTDEPGTGAEKGLLKAAMRRQEQLSRALRESRDIVSAILEHSLAGIYVIQDGTFRAINPIAASYTEYSPKDLIGSRTEALIHPADLPEVRRQARERLRGSQTGPYAFRIVTRRKKVKWVMEALSPFTFNGRPAILGNAMDVTDLKETVERLRESEDLYRAIFETTGTAAVIIEEDKTLSRINSEFEKLTGFRKEEWEGKRKWTEYIVREDLGRMEEYHRLRRIDPTAVPRFYEHRLIDSRGRIRDIFLTVDMIPGTKKSVAAFSDITERKESDRRLKKREEELEIKSRNLEELNTALRVLLRQREADREELEEEILANVKELVFPYLEKIRQSIRDPKAEAYVDVLESNLKDIISPFSRRLSSRYLGLTPKEIQIANFIKEGKSSKEIAGILSVSRSAVDIHRYRLRNKLGLNKKKANLRSHLAAVASAAKTTPENG